MTLSGEIKIIGLRLLKGNGALRAYADVQIGDVGIYEWRVLKTNGQRAQVHVPQTSWKNREGQVRYRALLSILGELRQRIEVAILSAWEKELSNDRSGQA